MLHFCFSFSARVSPRRRPTRTCSALGKGVGEGYEVALSKVDELMKYHPFLGELLTPEAGESLAAMLWCDRDRETVRFLATAKGDRSLKTIDETYVCDIVNGETSSPEQVVSAVLRGQQKVVRALSHASPRKVLDTLVATIRVLLVIKSMQAEHHEESVFGLNRTIIGLDALNVPATITETVNLKALAGSLDVSALVSALGAVAECQAEMLKDVAEENIYAQECLQDICSVIQDAKPPNVDSYDGFDATAEVQALLQEIPDAEELHEMEKSGELERLEWECIAGIPADSSSVPTDTFRSILVHSAHYRRKRFAAGIRDENELETSEAPDPVETGQGPNAFGTNGAPEGLRSERGEARNHGEPMVDGRGSSQSSGFEDAPVEHRNAAVRRARAEARDGTRESGRDGNSNSTAKFRMDVRRHKPGYPGTSSADDTKQSPIGQSDDVSDQAGTDKAAERRSAQSNRFKATDRPRAEAYGTQRDVDDDFEDYDAGAFYS